MYCPPLKLPLACLTVLLAPLWAMAAPPSIKNVFPAGVQQGQTVVITATGSFSTWPPQVWVDRPGISVKPVADAKSKGKFEVVADADAVGQYWFRAYDAEGATRPVAFVVGTIADVQEKEPNDSLEQSQEISSLTCTIHGRLEKSGDVDAYRVSLKAGQSLSVRVDANYSLGSPMDAIVQVARDDGIVLLQNDDYRGLDPGLDFQAPADGNYLVRIFAFPSVPTSSVQFAGGPDFVYQLILSTDPMPDWGLTPPDGAATIRANAPRQPLEPGIVAGVLAEPGAVASYELKTEKSQRWGFGVASRRLGTLADLRLTVRDSNGSVLMEADDTSGQRDPAMVWVARAAGTYQVEVADLHLRGGPRYIFQLKVIDGGLPPSATVATTEWIAERGKPLEIPIAVARASGANQELTFQVEGLPEGVVCDPVVSKPSSDTANNVKLILKADKAPKEGFNGPIRITASDGDELSFIVTAPTVAAYQNTPDLWLTVK